MTQDSHASQVLTQLESMLVDSVCGVFGDADMAVGEWSTGNALPAAAGAPVVTSVLGYAGEQLRGALVLLTASEAAARWAESAGASASDDAVADTVGELSNMVLGRLKYALLTRGVIIMLATPTTATGLEVHFAAYARGPFTLVRFEIATGPFFVRLEANFEPTLVLAEASHSAETAAAGEEMLF